MESRDLLGTNLFHSAWCPPSSPTLQHVSEFLSFVRRDTIPLSRCLFITQPWKSHTLSLPQHPIGQPYSLQKRTTQGVDTRRRESLGLIFEPSSHRTGFPDSGVCSLATGTGPVEVFLVRAHCCHCHQHAKPRRTTREGCLGISWEEDSSFNWLMCRG